jgi:hypothetical protein
MSVLTEASAPPKRSRHPRSLVRVLVRKRMGLWEVITSAPVHEYDRRSMAAAEAEALRIANVWRTHTAAWCTHTTAWD